MEFLLGLFLGYLLFSKDNKYNNYSYSGTRVVKCTIPLSNKRPPRNK